jgi:outer membrane lipase/esterase
MFAELPMRQFLIVFAAGLYCSGPASAQDFTQAIIFGDSSVDSGWWAGAFDGQCDGMPSGPCTPANFNSQKNRKIAAAIDAGSNGAPVGAGALMNSQLLAGYFGLSADPSNQPGGTNYAISGSTAAEANGAPGNLNQNPLLPSTVEQMANYLTAHGGTANPNGLYLISSGGNDITYSQEDLPNGAARRAFLDAQADELIEGIGTLKAAGARYFVVDSNHGPGGPGTLGEFYTQQLWTGLADAGVNFVPADISSMVRAVRADPTRFGFTAATVMPGVISGGTSTGSACVIHQGAANPRDGWGQWCVNTTTPSADYAYLASPDAQQTYFYADDSHFSAAGQKIEADYVYGLLVAPSQISMLAETAVASRTSLVNGIQQQIEASRAHTSGGPFNVWATGDLADRDFGAASGFSAASGGSASLAAGLSYELAPWITIGAAVSTGRGEPEWGGGRGGFDQEERTASAYAALHGDALWASVVATYGALDYEVDRYVPLGIGGYANHGETEGDNWSVGGRVGYEFDWNGVSIGPVAGLLWQRADIAGFTETVSNVTSLGFSDQSRDSFVSTLGWRAKVRLGDWQPFAEVAWHHEFASPGRSVTADLTSASYAPAYTLPAAQANEDWGAVTLGTTVALDDGVVVLGSVRTEFDADGAQGYGAQLGFNVSF